MPSTPATLLLAAALLAAAASARPAADADAVQPQAAVEAAASSPAAAAAPRATADAARTARDAVVAVEALRSVALDTDRRGSVDTNGFVVAVDGGRGIVATDHWGSAARASPAVYNLRFADGGSVPVRKKGGKIEKKGGG